MNYLHEYAKPFFYNGGEEGCLLIHGFTGTPAHMRLLGEFLKNEGYTVSGILLRGHGTSMEDMRDVTWKDWMDDVYREYEALRKKCRKVYVMGVSMGGILSLLLAENYPVDKVVSIAAPIKIYDKLAPFTPILKYFKPVHMWRPSMDQEGESIEYKVEYDGFLVSTVPSLLKLMKNGTKNLDKITCPALIIQSRMDKTVKPESAQLIYDGISSKDKKILWLDRSKHVCVLGPEREYIHGEILDFLQR